MARAETPARLLHNGDFRRLWLGDAVSLLGDWFTYVAVGVVAVEAGEGLVAVALLLVAYTLPRALLAPLAGRLADRHDRRTIMVVASALRALIVVAMIVAAWAEALGVLQLLLLARMGLAAMIEPAATAALPTLVGRGQLGRANALMGATWSVMFGLGVAAGGVVTALAGPIWALAIDAGTFVIAAAVFATLPSMPARAVAGPGAEPERPPARAGGWRIAWARPQVLQAALAKTPAMVANGGAWVLLHDLVARSSFAPLGAVGLGLGLLHAARALGTGVGPVLWFGRLRGTVLGLRAGTALTLIAVASLALVTSPALAVLAVCAWGVGVGATWVCATTRIQTLSANEALGRVASLDLALASLAQCVGGLAGAWLADRSSSPALAAWSGVGLGAAAWLSVGLLVALARRASARRGSAGSVTALVAGSLALLVTSGCSVSPAAPAAGAWSGLAPASAPADAGASRDPALDQLAALAVHHDDFARAELYTWTTLDQLRRVRETRVLLMADPETGGRASPFNQALIALARASEGSATGEIATRLVEDPALRRHRYAWPSPFATTMGLAGRRYGDSLIRVELDARAWIGRLEPGAAAPLVFVDMSGQLVAPARVLAEPERIGAIYHLRGPGAAPIAYREYVLCSEAMIRAWSIATAQIHARVAREIELLEALQVGALAQLPEAAVREAAAPDWARAREAPTPLALWHASLAFDNARYQPGAAQLEAIRVALRGHVDDGGPPLTHEPNAGGPR